MKQAYERLDSVFSKLNPDRHYILPLSGGLDSRLMAAFMAKHLPKDHIHPVTYGYDPRIYEYKYAKQVCKALGLSEPVFHELTSETYTRNLKPFAQKTGGNLGIQHSHLIDYVCNNEHPANLVSSAYSDGVFGFDATKTRDDGCEYLRMAKGSPVYDAIRNDLAPLFNDWRLSSITSLDEYIFLFERHAKLHFWMTNLLADRVNVVTPFTDPVVYDFYFSMPNKYRYRKQGTVDMMEKYFPELRGIKEISSNFFYTGPRTPIRFAHFKAINFLNYLSARFLNDRILINNPFQTETQTYNLRTAHRKLLEWALDHDEFVNMQHINKPRGTATLGYQVINAAYVLALMRGAV